MDAFGTSVSMSLQYGVPLEDYVRKFSHMRFEPQGYTKNPDIRIAKSLIDYIFRWLGITFLPGYKEANSGLVPKKTEKPSSSEDSTTVTKPVDKMSDGQDATKTELKAAANGHASGATNGQANGHAHGQTNGHSNGHANGHSNGYSSLLERAGAMLELTGEGGTRNEQFANFQSDAPSCDGCGSITVRNGNCYLCHNCGASMGCS